MNAARTFKKIEGPRATVLVRADYDKYYGISLL